MAGSPHIIRKLSLEIQTKLPRREALRCQEYLKDSLKGEVMAEINRFLSQIGPQEEVIRIPKIEVKLSRLSNQRMTTVFVQECVDRIKAAISSEVMARKPLGIEKHGSDSASQHSMEADQMLRNQQVTNTDPAAIQRFTLLERSYSLFYYFLQYGSFPWWAKGWNWSDWERRLTGGLTTRKSEVIPFLAQDHHRLTRLTNQFSLAFLQALLEGLENKRSTNALNHIDLQAQDARSKISQQLDALLRYATGPNAPSEGNHLHDGSVVKMSAKKQGDGDKPGNTFDTTSPIKSFSSLISENSRIANTGFMSEIPEEDTESGLFIENAGLVLLLPCLTPLFKNLNYLDADHNFRSHEKQQRAIHLLQFLVNEHPGASEDQLVLNKIACAYPLTTPLVRHLQLQKAEKEEARQFIQSILKEWPMMEKASIDSLRHNFLMRDGILEQRDNHWQLVVSKVAYDPFLLQNLPWTISIVKLPWMQTYLKVDWL